eukprot:17863-Heterococcus_DN1.PRE.5
MSAPLLHVEEPDCSLLACCVQLAVKSMQAPTRSSGMRTDGRAALSCRLLQGNAVVLPLQIQLVLQEAPHNGLSKYTHYNNDYNTAATHRMCVQ